MTERPPGTVTTFDEDIGVGREPVETTEMDFLDGEYIDENYQEDLDYGGNIEPLAEGEVDIVEIFDSLPSEEKAAVLATDYLAQFGRSEIRSPLFIDKKAVPKRLTLYWISRRMAENGWGYRGYRPVQRTAKTQAWVPNCKQYGRRKEFVIGPYVLCAIPTRVYLARKAAQWQSGNTRRLEDLSSIVKGALEANARRYGIDPTVAKKIDESTGVHFSKSPDPEGPRDLMDAGKVEQTLSKPQGRRKRGSLTRRTS